MTEVRTKARLGACPPVTDLVGLRSFERVIASSRPGAVEISHQTAKGTDCRWFARPTSWLIWFEIQFSTGSGQPVAGRIGRKAGKNYSGESKFCLGESDGRMLIAW